MVISINVIIYCMCFAKFRNPTVTSRISAGYMADIRHPDHGFRRQGIKKLTKSRVTKRKEKNKENAKRLSHHTESIQFNPSISACGRFKLCFTYTFLSFSSLKHHCGLSSEPIKNALSALERS